MDISLRKVEEKDVEIIYKWRNDPSIRKRSINSNEIVLDEHRKYWSGRLEDSSSYSYIIVVDGKDAGITRLDKRGIAHELSILVSPQEQGKGIGTVAIALTKIEAKKLGIKRLSARIKPENRISKDVFSRNGFSESYEVFECEL